jgi:peptidoglycan/xylan/chitin deacetylase (PgdA/CDA1 family)
MQTLILFYHSISENSDRRIDPSIVVSPAHFDEQVRYLTSHTQVIALETFVDGVKNGKPLPQNSVIITFDDGYRDNLTNALPILKKYNAPATFFIATDLISNGKGKWEDRMCYGLYNSKVKKLVIESDGLANGSLTIPLETSRDRERAFFQLITTIGYLPLDARQPVIAQLEAQLDLRNQPETEPLMLAWDEVRVMAADPNVTIGSHTVSHARLSLLTDEEVRHEVVDSKAQLEKELSKPIHLFSYPYGTPVDFDERVKQTLRDSGYDAAVSTRYVKNNGQSDLFDLGRVLGADSTGLSFSIGTQLRASVVGTAMRHAVTLWRRNG